MAARRGVTCPPLGQARGDVRVARPQAALAHALVGGDLETSITWDGASLGGGDPSAFCATGSAWSPSSSATVVSRSRSDLRSGSSLAMHAGTTTTPSLRWRCKPSVNPSGGNTARALGFAPSPTRRLSTSGISPGHRGVATGASRLFIPTLAPHRSSPSWSLIKSCARAQGASPGPLRFVPCLRAGVSHRGDRPEGYRRLSPLHQLLDDRVERADPQGADGRVFGCDDCRHPSLEQQRLRRCSRGGATD